MTKKIKLEKKSKKLSSEIPRKRKDAEVFFYRERDIYTFLSCSYIPFVISFSLNNKNIQLGFIY